VKAPHRVRDLRRGDIDAVMAIDATAYPRPWERQLYLDDIGDPRRARHLVALDGRTVVGHGGIVYLDGDAHVSTVAVHPDHLGRGIATGIMGRLVDLAGGDGCRAMTLEVRVDNERAQALYRRCGFAPVGVRPGYYDDPNGRVDALIMWLHDLPAAGQRIATLLGPPVAMRGAQ
jgi:ribosomal-protein-alanine N-acetyltransferase